MATGTIVDGTVLKSNGRVSASIRVSEGGAMGNVEYNVSTDRKKSDGTNKTNAEIKADLLTECTAARNAQTATPTAQAGVSGTVTV